MFALLRTRRYMSCPGAPKCNGHGACLSMDQLAEHTTDNGDATAFTYGNRPNYFKTWDYNKVFGCKCDSGFTGYDCSLRTSEKGVGVYCLNKKVVRGWGCIV